MDYKFFNLRLMNAFDIFINFILGIVNVEIVSGSDDVAISQERFLRLKNGILKKITARVKMYLLLYIIINEPYLKDCSGKQCAAVITH